MEMFKALECNMSFQIYFLHAYLDHFPENLGDVNEEKGEGCPRDIR